MPRVLHQPLRITKLRPNGEVLKGVESVETPTDSVLLAAGTYQVVALVEGDGRESKPTKVTIRPGHTREITIALSIR